MMKMKITAAVLFVILFSLSGFSQYKKDYKDGSAWSITFVRTNSGMGDTYLTDLKETWRAIQDEAVKQGLIVSYKILQGVRSNPDDWDIMLMVEFRNLAAMESSEEKMNEIMRTKVGDEQAMKKLQESRMSVRTLYGEKIMREVIYQ